MRTIKIAPCQSAYRKFFNNHGENKMNTTSIKEAATWRNKSAKGIMSTLLLIIIATFAMSNVAKAQPGTPECIDGTQIPAYYQPYTSGSYTMLTSNGCRVKYYYCYRCDCPSNATSPTYCYYDCYISSIQYEGNCSDPLFGWENATFNTIYNNLYGACLADLVARNPWDECMPGGNGLKIPNCDEKPGQSAWVYRAGKPSCTSDLYYFWEDGYLWCKTAPCNVSGLGYYCFNIYTFCWQTDPITDRKKLIPTLVSSGTPSTYQCPPIYSPEEEGAFPTQINCNAMCGE